MTSLINTEKHVILEASHPSPLARGGFSGCRHFSQCNSVLRQHSLSPINWNISDDSN